MMIRQHETPYSVLAGLLAILMHVMLFAALFFSVNWKSVHIATEVMEVELWEQLPDPSAKPIPKPKPVKKVVPPKPKPKPKPIPVEEPKIEEPKIEEPKVEEPKVDIALEKKKKEEETRKKKEAEKKKRLKEIERKKKLAKQLLLEDEKAEEEERKKKLAQQLLEADAKAESDRRARAAAQGEVNKFIAKIQAKVRGNVNKSLCGTGNPQLKFKVDILPTGDIAREPTLVKSSGLEACDEAVSRALLASQPLPLPQDPVAKSQFRNLAFTFKPNE